MKTLYLDLISGISGDMFLGALLDLGVPLPALEQELAKLKIGGYHLHVHRRRKAGIEGIKFDVHLEESHGHAHAHPHADGSTHSHPHDHAHEHGHEHGHDHQHEHPHGHHHHDHGHDPAHSHEHEHEHGAHDHDHEHEGSRDFAEIKRLIRKSDLTDWVKERAIAVFHRIAAAEGKIHGMPPEQVHFHEVGAVDSIVDIVGGCIALELLGRPRVLASSVTEGTGTVKCAHGVFPVPAPATLEILRARGVPFSQCDEPGELVTPTGAALVAALAESFGPMPPIQVVGVGYGLGTRDNRTRPNVLRAILAEAVELPAGKDAAATGAKDWETDTVAVVETNLDDVSAEVLGEFVERALAAGALDAFFTPIQMKKSRPGVLLTVLAPPADADRFAEMVLTHTSAFGVRIHLAERRKLRRDWIPVTTPHGEVRVKVGMLDGRRIQAAPEFEDCRRVAGESKVPLKQVYDAALRALPAEDGHD